MYPSVVRSLGFSLVAPDSMALVRSTGLAVDLTPQDRARLPRPTKPLWRKREIVRQERTVQYTTVDADGALQVIPWQPQTPFFLPPPFPPCFSSFPRPPSPP